MRARKTFIFYAFFFNRKHVCGPRTDCQISTDLDKILHTPVVVQNALVGRLRPRSAHGRLQAKPKRLCFL